MPSVDRQVLKRARSLRRAMSLPEVLLWRAIRDGKISARFRRQHPMGPFVLDFFCDKPKLAVEVDGAAHGCQDQPERDERPDRWLRRQGVRVLRIPARVVLSDIDVAVRTIQGCLRR